MPDPRDGATPVPAEIGRVLLLYSGGLDTSVMVRWIQEHYARRSSP
jgi:argininosuccinate synthase